MVRVFVRHTVADYERWKQEYDSFDKGRGELGVRGDAVFQSVDNPRDVTVWHDFDGLEQAQAFVSSEELLQALGPINDDPTVRWSMFNDNVHLGFFGVYDQYVLNILYHPHIRPGMTRAEVQAVMPVVLPQVRAFVAKINNLPP